MSGIYICTMDSIFELSEIDHTAHTLLAKLPNPCVVALYGEMGAGKTTLVAAMCRALGVQDAVSSPTFGIINEYEDLAGRPVYHIDLYRIKDEEEAVQAGVEECFYSAGYCFVEWPQKAASLIPGDAVRILSLIHI